MSHTSRQFSLKALHPLKKSTTFSTHKILPTISEHREVKKNTAKDLTQAISRFNTLNKNQGFKHTEDLLRCSMNVLRAFSAMQNNFQELFQDLYIVFKRYCFGVDDAQILEILSNYRLKEGCSLRKICTMMDIELGQIIKKNNKEFNDLQKQHLSLVKKYDELDAEWKKDKAELLAEAARLKKLTNIEYTQELQDTVEDQKTKISELQAEIKHLTKDNEKFLQELDQYEIQTEELKYEKARLEADVHDLKQWQDKNQEYIFRMKDKFDGLLVKMMGIKENIAKVEEQNQGLVSERMKLINRAAVGFQDLTPRPKYKELFGIPVKSHINSTMEIVANLIDNSNIQPQKMVQSIILRKKNYKLEETEAIRSQLVDETIKGKEQIKKL